MMHRKLRMGMIGGGQGAFIGAVHRMAAALDGEIELVCGAFSSSAERSQASGHELYLPADRVYDDYTSMIETEAQLSDDVKMDFVSIVTPNHMHFAPAALSIKHGFHVVCDKPITYSLAEAKKIKAMLSERKVLFALTHNYTGYPMVKQARQMIAKGDIGKVRKVVVAYPQGWLSTMLEKSDQKQAVWRTDPSKSGKAGAMGDIGTHAENLCEYITGLQITSLCADINTVVAGRQLDDDGNVLLRFDNGANGILYASQIAAGEENALSIRIYGEKAGLEWRQMEPNTLKVKWLDKSTEIMRTGVGDLYPVAQAHTRLPAGHPEGYLEAFANIYRNFAMHIRAHAKGEAQNLVYDYPTVDDGIRGMQFIDTVIASGQSSEKWIAMT